MNAESAGEGLGSTFTIHLPLAEIKERKKRRGAGGRFSARSKTDIAVESLPSLADVQILLIDDDKDTLQVLSVMLEQSKATVQTAGSVAEAFETLEWFNPDVVVSDLAMPGEDGYSLISKLRALDAASGKETPAVALTSYVRVEDRARALSAGFNMFVAKPVQPNELVDAIASLSETEQ